MVVKFLRELKRRRVLRTASWYVLGAWIALQAVEVLSQAGLPPDTMRKLLIALSAGFPVVLVAGWFFDISAEGISKTGPLTDGEALPALKFIDHLLLIGLALVVVLDVYILSSPPPSDTIVVETGSQQRTIAVLGFEDLDLAVGADPVGGVLAGEFRDSLTRIAGLRVLGPETSAALSLAGSKVIAMASELHVTALLLGEVRLIGDQIRIGTQLLGIPAGNELWTNGVEGPISDTAALQQDLVRQIVGAVAPTLDADPHQGPRADAGTCSEVYDLYLRGKQLSLARQVAQADRYQRGMELLREAVSRDERCALAWEALAVAEVNWTMPGFAKAGAAARRALELNDALPEAWTVLAEIAEEEKRWSESEEYFLRALYSDPTNIRALTMYSEALLARGRVTDALHQALEAYRYDPASPSVNWRVSLAAKFAGKSELVIKHANTSIELVGERHAFNLDQLAEGYLGLGDMESALQIYEEMGERVASWFPDCVAVSGGEPVPPGLVDAMNTTLARYENGELNRMQGFWWTWQLIRCATWIGNADFVFDLFEIEKNLPTEAMFFLFFFPDAGALRQDPRFREFVADTNLLDYWRQWGWSDYCEPDGNGFRCD